MSEISKLDQNLIIKKIDEETVNLQITDNEMLMSIVGQFDQNLKELAKLTNTSNFFRGNSITCKGRKKDTKDFLWCNKIFNKQVFFDKNYWEWGYNAICEKKYWTWRVKCQII